MPHGPSESIFLGGTLDWRAPEEPKGLLEVPQIRHPLAHCDQNSSANPHAAFGEFFKAPFRLRFVL
jgi:hypothetical protein